MSPTTTPPVRNRRSAGSSLSARQIVQTLKLSVGDLDRQLHLAQRLGRLAHRVKVIEQTPRLACHASQLALDHATVLLHALFERVEQLERTGQVEIREAA